MTERKSVIVTGAANGIGKAITYRCLEEGFRVLACDIHEAGLATLREEKNVSTFKVDVSNYGQVKALFEQLAKEEEPSYLVNNAGINLAKNILDYTEEEILRVTAINYFGAVYFSQQFAKQVLALPRKSVIVNISSVSGQEGSSDAVYGSSKAALIGLTRSCAMNFAPWIRVNAIAPGLVSTDLIRKVPASRIQEYRSAELIKEPILPEDVANTVAFLLSPQSGHYTGAIFDINNGQYRR
jgi:3-oxoacyl-[acyl-carrier protein] reductase